MNIAEHHRIILLGNNGSGKSFFARELAAITDLPLTHLDREFWLPNWEMPTEEEWMEKNRKFIAEKEWILDGMCSYGTMELRFAAADLVLFLDFNRIACLAGVIKRTGKLRPDFPEYLTKEKSAIDFLRFCLGVLRFPRNRKKRILRLHETYPDIPFLIIKSRRNMRKLLNQWRNEFA